MILAEVLDTSKFVAEHYGLLTGAFATGIGLTASGLYFLVIRRDRETIKERDGLIVERDAEIKRLNQKFEGMASDYLKEMQAAVNLEREISRRNQTSSVK